MPLTKSDLQQIGNVVDQKLEKRLAPIEKDISSLKQDVGGLKQDVGKINKSMQYLKKKINKMDKTLDIVARNYDEGDVALGKRVKRIETHLNLAA